MTPLSFPEWMSRRPRQRIRRVWCWLVGHSQRQGDYVRRRCARCWLVIFGRETER